MCIYIHIQGEAGDDSGQGQENGRAEEEEPG